MMSGDVGRPLRFAAILLSLWAMSRAAFVWFDQDAPDARVVGPITHPMAGAGRSAVALPAPLPMEGGGVRMTPALAAAMARLRAAGSTPRASEHPGHHRAAIGTRLIDVREPGRAVRAERVQLAMLAAVHVASSTQLVDRYFADAPRLRAPAAGDPRWSGSAWLFARSNGVPAAAGAGQLGGAQAGGRVRYRLDDEGLSAAAGAAIPLASRGREAMVALEWQPRASPIRLVAEQRIPLDDSISGGPGVGAVAGVGPTDIGLGFDLEGFGQAGAVARARLEPYVEGGARVARPVASARGTRFEVGAGLWASAQRDAHRVDVGPALSATLPIAGQRFRVAIDWRERVAGGARPDSGPALSIGTDF